eukprot:119069-Hanusia_phi.AAC.1
MPSSAQGHRGEAGGGEKHPSDCSRPEPSHVILSSSTADSPGRRAGEEKCELEQESARDDVRTELKRRSRRGEGRGGGERGGGEEARRKGAGLKPPVSIRLLCRTLVCRSERCRSLRAGRGAAEDSANAASSTSTCENVGCQSVCIPVGSRGGAGEELEESWRSWRNAGGARGAVGAGGAGVTSIWCPLARSASTNRLTVCADSAAGPRGDMGEPGRRRCRRRCRRQLGMSWGQLGCPLKDRQTGSGVVAVQSVVDAGALHLDPSCEEETGKEGKRRRDGRRGKREGREREEKQEGRRKRRRAAGGGRGEVAEGTDHEAELLPSCLQSRERSLCHLPAPGVERRGEGKRGEARRGEERRAEERRRV